jgi:hypothetical protein
VSAAPPLAAGLALALLAVGGPAGAQGTPDRRYLEIRPAYGPAPAGLVRLAPPAPSPVRPPGWAADPVWVPGRLDPVPALDARGRLIHVLEETPGRYAR